ncbi:hypothetical protein UFOVP87_40 [uncultured Caudovirales phage]|uniref:Uncharacterized protein n=1 Tax=uncultured Caudovirales phage TaxID=2100421 RepID=A0A6J5L1H5_9CAUD|nr:hypothetical protein UFOVP87_40 [uncultured Caudovirales phage]
MQYCFEKTIETKYNLVFGSLQISGFSSGEILLNSFRASLSVVIINGNVVIKKKPPIFLALSQASE